MVLIFIMTQIIQIFIRRFLTELFYPLNLRIANLEIAHLLMKKALQDVFTILKFDSNVNVNKYKWKKTSVDYYSRPAEFQEKILKKMIPRIWVGTDENSILYRTLGWNTYFKRGKYAVQFRDLEFIADDKVAYFSFDGTVVDITSGEGVFKFVDNVVILADNMTEKQIADIWKPIYSLLMTYVAHGHKYRVSIGDREMKFMVSKYPIVIVK